MVTVVGFRFRPTDEEIVDHYLRLKNLGDSTSRSYVDQAITTLDICSFDPWELPSHSRMESRDQVWYFFGSKENKYNRGERQNRGTKSGFWKKTGVTTDIKRKRGNHEKIGEKRVLMFYTSGSKSNWVMHEYHATCLSPTQNMTYTICKVQFKGAAREISSSGSEIVEHTHSLTSHINKNNSGRLSTGSEELQNPLDFSGVLHKQQETQLEVIQTAFDNLSSYDWKSLLDVVDDYEQSKTASRQKSATNVFIGHR